jgi:F420-dependent oxidoreductase-like protein
MRICLMIEGQQGVTWEQWRALAAACEEHGLDGLFRSDHYYDASGGDTDPGSLDAWGTICALAGLTERIRLGTLVSPATFRHPSILAKLVLTADHVSGGRVSLGIGSGWMAREHEAYGLPFPPIGERFDLLEEQLQVLETIWAPGPSSHQGAHYTLTEADRHPKPVQQPHPPILLGGSARPRAAALAARHASEYNLVYVTPDELAEPRARLDRACRDAGRDPATLPLSAMLVTAIGRDRAEADERGARLQARAGDHPPSAIVGTVEEAAARLREYAAAGLDGAMLQYLLHEDVDGVAAIGELAAMVRDL